MNLKITHKFFKPYLNPLSLNSKVGLFLNHKILFAPLQDLELVGVYTKGVDLDYI